MNILIVSVIKVIQNLSSDYNTIGAISGTGTVYTSGASAFTSSSHFIGVHGGRSLVFCTVLWNIVRLLYLLTTLVDTSASTMLVDIPLITTLVDTSPYHNSG
jgi:hypothetical protein